MANIAPNSRQGRPNKNKKFLLARLQDEYGEQFHPIMQMAKNAHQMQSLLENLPEDTSVETLFIALKQAIDSWEKIAQYTEPKLKAMEVKHTTMPKVKTIDLGGKPTLSASVINGEITDERTTNNTDRNEAARQDISRL